MHDCTAYADHDRQHLGQLINGFMASQAIHVAVSLSVPDLLKDGALSSERLAASTGTHAQSLYRLLRALAAIGILHETDDRHFSLTPLGWGLAGSMEESQNAWARFVARPPLWVSWGNLLHSVRTGETGFQHVHGQDVWSYRAGHPEESAIFDQAMRQASERIGRALVAAYDFTRVRHVVDVGGGNGALLAVVLAAFPHTEGLLLDLSHVVSGAQQVLQDAGVSARCAIVRGSFFDHVPPDADLYLLKNILHDWGDNEAVHILRNCRRSMGDEARLVIIERLLEPANAGVEGKLSDLNMLVNTGGRERTEAEYEAILRAADLKVSRTLALAGNRHLLEAVPMEAAQ